MRYIASISIIAYERNADTYQTIFTDIAGNTYESDKLCAKKFCIWLCSEPCKVVLVFYKNNKIPGKYQVALNNANRNMDIMEPPPHPTTNIPQKQQKFWYMLCRSTQVIPKNTVMVTSKRYAAINTQTHQKSSGRPTMSKVLKSMFFNIANFPENIIVDNY